jgi:hypothetical protein
MARELFLPPALSPAQAYSHGFAIDAPDLKGSTGMGELGLIFKLNDLVRCDT